MSIFQVFTKDCSQKSDKIVLRDEQREAIELAEKAFAKKNFSAKKAYLKFLWNAKMRFGKTLCALHLAKKMGFKQTLIVTHRPVVDQGWEEDFHKTFADDIAHYRYGRKFNDCDEDNFYALQKFANTDGNHYVFFVSMQYLRLSALVRQNGDHDKLKEDILNNNWDFVVVDEAHEGTQTNLGEKVIQHLSKAGSKVLHLSGTPFNLYDDFADGEIFTWDYIAEQTAKANWEKDHPGEFNPYQDLPRMKIYTYDLGKLIKGEGLVAEDAEFKFSEFFRTWTGNPKADGAEMPEGAKGRFVREEAVKEFINLLCRKDGENNYPFSTDEYRKSFKHTLWVVPGVKAAAALQQLLREHKIFKNFKIVNVAGHTDDDERSDNALDKVNNAIGNAPEQTQTITISCGRLTTGTTVRPWTAVFYMKGSEMTSASTYMQTIFRVQTPYHTNDGRMKAECYVFDFAPDRSLKMMAETAKFSNRTQKGKKKTPLGGDEEDIETMKEFLSFCPVISLDGGKMVAFDEHKLFNQLRQVMIDRVVRNGFNDNALYNIDFLMSLDDSAIEKLNQMGEEIAKTTNMEKPAKAAPATDMAKNGLTTEQKKKAEEAKKKKKEGKQLTPEEKEVLDAERKEKEAKRKERDNRISILRGISLRIPLIIFGAEIKEGEEITIDNFTDIVDDASWEEFMPKGVSKDDFKQFRKCYDTTIFTSSGKKIRSLTREADSLPVDERIKAIATIHSYFHNPDKETVLTPWRVVNMHLSDTLGGYCFFNEQFDGPNMKELSDEDGKTQWIETTEPRWVDQGDVTKNIFKQVDSGGECPVRILEINSKTGLYPLYMAYSLYRSIIPVWASACDDPENLSAEEQHALWDEIMQRNIFVICNTSMAARITERTLCGFRKDQDGNKIKMHIQSVNLIDQAQNDMAGLIKSLNKENFWFKNGVEKEMKFDAIVGNPPYQLAGGSGGNNDAPIYQHFCKVAEQLSSRYVSLVIPSRWFAAGRENLLGQFRKDMLSCNKIKYMKVFSQANSVFSNVEIKGGVCFYLFDKTHNDTCHYCLIDSNGSMHDVENRDLGQFDILIRDTQLSVIVSKVEKKRKINNLKTVDALISADTPFGIPSNPRTSKKTPFKVYETSSLDHDTLLYHIENQKRKQEYTNRSLITKNAKDIDKPKVFITGAAGSGNDPIVIGEPIVAPKNSVCSQSYLYAAFGSNIEAENFVRYMKTRFFRVLVSAIKITQSAPDRVYKFVPHEDFSAKSDIKWDEDIEKIEAQLYDKYDLNEDDISYINSHIKPME